MLWAALAHCAFGLWQQTFFIPLFAGSANVNLSDRSWMAISDVQDLVTNGSHAAKRIVQDNGLALLALFILLGFWLVAGRCVAGNMQAGMLLD